MLQSDHTRYITSCDTDEDGNLVLTFPDELLDAMGWGEGTEISIEAMPGTIIMREYPKSSLSEVA
jgi:bifunctional DNA-binding transcriptional regulator/antitoxin component of YhaV-PrlF toxin-antitoxin module